MALSWRIGTCHTQHRCGPCSSALAPQARSAASAHVRQPRGCALLWIARSQASTLRGARSVCSAAVEAEAAVAAAPVERERLLDGSSPKDSDSGTALLCLLRSKLCKGASVFPVIACSWRAAS